MVIQVAETVLPMFDVPEGALRPIVVILALGFPLALVFAWVFELMPEGLRREKDVEVSPATKQQTAHKLNLATLIAAMLANALLIADGMLPESEPAATAVAGGSATTTAPADAVDSSPDPASIAGPCGCRRACRMLPHAADCCSARAVVYHRGIAS